MVRVTGPGLMPPVNVAPLSTLANLAPLAVTSTDNPAAWKLSVRVMVTIAWPAAIAAGAVAAGAALAAVRRSFDP